ncbi:hypothetical protein Leryth_016823 [Lithospermum erythrorhizon]|nr:hypothetical protein Leryth_016823 [Lithospermum erythrorhizon]
MGTKGARGDNIGGLGPKRGVGGKEMVAEGGERFKYDKYDRIWSSLTLENTTALSTASIFVRVIIPARLVMKTASTPSNTSDGRLRNLSSKKLAGSIAPAIFELKALKELNLRGNNFSKPFPQLLLNKAKSGVLKFE